MPQWDQRVKRVGITDLQLPLPTLQHKGKFVSEHPEIILKLPISQTMGARRLHLSKDAKGPEWWLFLSLVQAATDWAHARTGTLASELPFSWWRIRLFITHTYLLVTIASEYAVWRVEIFILITLMPTISGPLVSNQTQGAKERDTTNWSEKYCIHFNLEKDCNLL